MVDYREPRKTRRRRKQTPVNETMFLQQMGEEGWKTTRELPGVFCQNKEGRIMFVETTPPDRRHLNPDVIKVMRCLVKAGILCFWWDLDNGLTPVAINEPNLFPKSKKPPPPPKKVTAEILD